MRLSTRLGLGLGLMALMLVGVGGMALFYVESLTDLNAKLYRHPYAVSKAVLRLEGNFQRLHFAISELVDDRKRDVIETQIEIVKSAEIEVLEDLRTLKERFLGDQDLVVRLERAESRIRATRNQIIALMNAQRFSEAQVVDAQLDTGARSERTQALEAIAAFATSKAAEYKSAAEQSRANALTVITSLAGLSTVLAFFLTLLTIRSVLRQVGGEPSQICALTERLAQGDLNVVFRNPSGIAAAVEAMAASFTSVAEQADAIAAGDYDVEFTPRSDRDRLGNALRNMNFALREARNTAAQRDRLQNGLARLDETMRGEPELHQLATQMITAIVKHIDAHIGALYLAEGDNAPVMTLVGTYAYTKRKNLSHRFALGEGLVGQAALEKQPILVSNISEDYIRVTSGLGDQVPRAICVIPFLFDGHVKGVVEVGSLAEFGEAELEYLNQAMPALAIAVHSAQSRVQLARSYEESQRLTEELQSQQEELKVTNEELEQQAQHLKTSEEQLRVQQEELQATNEELEEKNDLLERQKREVEQARSEIETKANELALASSYKSEFLANMSHELRTPLNSLLLLAQNLAQNKSGNLNEEQVEYAKIIHGSGSDLLNLINEILDLSKIEAGRMDVHISTIRTEELRDSIKASFAHLAQEKGIELELRLCDGAPQEFASDRKRVEQIIRNLVSNAIKFTPQGRVTVTFDTPENAHQPVATKFNAKACIMIAVQDTGIGIAPDKQGLVFEAFKQADGSTSRTYGGTGLGLTISRELAGLLGGEITLESVPDEGSIFRLYLPTNAISSTTSSSSSGAAHTPITLKDAVAEQFPRASLDTPYIQDDRTDLQAGDQVILVIEDDPKFALILLRKCHDKGFKCIAAPSGEAGLTLIARYTPCAIILDNRLPGLDGLTVLSALKENTQTRHIPVHMVSIDDLGNESVLRGAIGHAVKPLSQERFDEIFERLDQVCSTRTKRVLVIEDDPLTCDDTVALIESRDVEVDHAATGEQALEALRHGNYDCMVLDLRLPDMDGRELLGRLKREGVTPPPVVVYTASELSGEQELSLREQAESIVIKDVRSPERLLDEVTLFLHRVVSELPDRQQRIIRNLHDADAPLRDKTVLIVEDDMRTSFAMAGLLTERGMQPLKAENGERALQVLKQHPEIELVLMDIMMPVMDGYETMRRIRADIDLRDIPIIALTAKAMPEDKQKCLTAGANDYLSKPVDSEQLLSIMRVWLSQ